MGPLPASWSALTALTFIDLSSNALTGTLPREWASGTLLVVLRTINLAANQLWSTIPAEWGSGLPGLARLLVDDNTNL